MRSSPSIGHLPLLGRPNPRRLRLRPFADDLTDQPHTISAAKLRAAFDRAERHTVGIEDEVMLLHPETFSLAPVAEALMRRARDGDPLKPELPKAQLEILTPVADRACDLAQPLLDARRLAAAHADGLVLLAGAGVHPTDSTGPLHLNERYRHTLAEYGAVADRQLVCALQVHVAIGDAHAALAIYNHARGYLPLLAALAANAPVYEGVDTGFHSVRPLISGLLPRQGVPPPLRSFDELAEAYRWGESSGTFTPRSWWWELRPHPRYGTLEFRVPDGQTTVADGIALATVIQSLVAWLHERHDAGDALAVPHSWRIAENAWSAARHGARGRMADLDGGTPAHTADALADLLAALAPVAERLGGAAHLGHAQAMVERGGAERQREVFAADGAPALGAWLTERFLQPPSG